jgi:anaerobic ribonucleoside-triphosphate reductase activating protein
MKDMVAKMNYATIKPVDIANGAGVRVSLFVSGCTHHCKGCFNAEAWDFDFGEPFTKQTEDEIISLLDRPWIDGLSLLGGEPFELEHQETLLRLLERVHRELPTKTVWAYSGYTFEEIQDSPLLDYVDILVDGEFMEDQKNISLQFRGSENQRVIDVQETFASGHVVIQPDDRKGCAKDG